MASHLLALADRREAGHATASDIEACLAGGSRPAPWRWARLHAIEAERLLREGMLVGQAGLWLAPADRMGMSESRGAALLGIAPDRCVAVDATACWVHTGGSAPDRLSFGVAASTKPVHGKGFSCVQRTFGPADVWSVGSLRVTSPARTAIDVAARLPALRAQACLDALFSAGLSWRDAIRALETLGTRPLSRRAAEALAVARRRHEDSQARAGSVVAAAGLAPVRRNAS